MPNANQPMLPGFEPPAPPKPKYEGYLNVYSFIHRRYYHTAEEALADAREAIEDLWKLYVIKFNGGPKEIWQDGFFWTIMEREPFTGVVGAFYHGRPDYYVLTCPQMFLGKLSPQPEVFVKGESEEEVNSKSQRALEDFERIHGKLRPQLVAQILKSDASTASG